MAQPEPEELVFEFSGSWLCLDFANTLGYRRQRRPRERLHGYADLVSWGRQADTVTALQAEGLLEEAARRPVEATQVFRRALALREAVYRLFSAAAAGEVPAGDDIAVLNAELAQAMAAAQVIPTRDGFTWGWGEGGAALERLLWPVARSAAELLTSQELAVLRECAADDCGWLFTDTSKNRRRRWCNMGSCGNRAKVRRYYARKKQGRSSRGSPVPSLQPGEVSDRAAPSP